MRGTGACLSGYPTNKNERFSLGIQQLHRLRTGVFRTLGVALKGPGSLPP